MSTPTKTKCLSVTRAMRISSTAALKAILDLAPLHILMQGEAQVGAHRPMQGQTPICQSHRAENSILVMPWTTRLLNTAQFQNGYTKQRGLEKDPLVKAGGTTAGET